jgi:hypothetical protein
MANFNADPFSNNSKPDDLDFLNSFAESPSKQANTDDFMDAFGSSNVTNTSAPTNLFDEDDFLNSFNDNPKPA